MSVSLGMWSLKSSTELTRKGMWQDKTWRGQERDSPVRKWCSVDAQQEIFREYEKCGAFKFGSVKTNPDTLLIWPWSRPKNQTETFWKGRALSSFQVDGSFACGVKANEPRACTQQQYIFIVDSSFGSDGKLKQWNYYKYSLHLKLIQIA